MTIGGSLHSLQIAFSGSVQRGSHTTSLLERWMLEDDHEQTKII